MLLNPNDPRWWYYLGDTRDGLGDQAGAVSSFLRCWGCDGWDEESAWAMYRAASIESGRGHHQYAAGYCLLGLQRHAGIAELYWLAGFSCYQMGRHRDAILWCERAVQLGAHRGAFAQQERIGFRYPPALYEAPFDVLRYAYQALGDNMRAAIAEGQFHVALEDRLGTQKNGAAP